MQEDKFSGYSSSSSTKKVVFNTSVKNDYLMNRAYKTLRDNVFFYGQGVKTIVVTSNNVSEGKSTVSTELVRSFADVNKKSLLIDCDMRKSVMLKNSTRPENVKGISDVLSGFEKIEDVLYKTQDENFDVIFSGRFPPSPIELISNGKLKGILEQLSADYDYIVIDSPPLGVEIDAAVIATYCDGAIIVISNHKVSKESVINMKEQLHKSGCKILGVVFNETDKKASRYNY
ncbi:MAG: CpsD/CapB family tyrosine-protein kinase [Clostridia bacterium]|nr:CpsD/CapB family tyrosine-protein kinase [Clostridia bacterium]